MKITSQEAAYKFLQAHKKGERIEIMGIKFLIKELQFNWPDLGFQAEIKLVEVIEL